MGIILTFVFNSGLNLVLGLAMAAVLAPVEYGRFAIAFMASIVLGTALFEWLRYATTRFIAGDNRSPSTKASIETGYALLGLILIGLACVAQASSGLSEIAGVPTLLVAVTAMANARFEFRAAEARALFQDGIYIRLVLVKNVAALLLMLGVGIVLHSATWVLAMMALSALASSLIAGRRLDNGEVLFWRRDAILLASFARFGLPIVAANLLYQIAILGNRAFAAKSFGLAEAGSLSLATDLTIRLLVSVGAALDAYLFQIAVRRHCADGEAAAMRQAGDNLLSVGGVLGVLTIGYAATLPTLEALFVPSAYRGSFAEISLILLPGVYLFCLSQFGFSPMLQLSRRTAPLLWSACFAVIADFFLLMIASHTKGDIAAIAAIHSVALAIGALSIVPWIGRSGDCLPSRRETAKVATVIVAVACAMWPFRSLGPTWLSLIGACAAGGGLAIILPFALDIQGCRERLLGLLNSRWLPALRARK